MMTIKILNTKEVGKQFVYVSDIKYTSDRIGVLPKKYQKKKRKKN